MATMVAGVIESNVRAEFHANVFRLFKKSQEPCEPVNYRGREYISTGNYVLLHEEEQHLADSIAFLGQTKEGPNCVSAVTVEQYLSPPSLTIRLASNKTPSLQTVDRLSQVLETVAEYARQGTGRETFQTRIFDQILALSRERLLFRLRSRHDIRRSWPPPKTSVLPLHDKINRLLEDISSQNLIVGVDLLSEHLTLLRNSLIDVEENPSTRLAETLESAVRRSWEVSNLNNTKSLETQLQALGATEELYKSRLVLDIDKISRYLEICKYLMRFSRHHRSRAIFSDIRLEVCTAPPICQPQGSRIRCGVHGEVQLVLHYEQFPKTLPPRCIGSSKSACYLCDLFIEKHGSYHISHSHKRLYEKWTVPNPSWMTPDQVAKFEVILSTMNEELVRQINLKRPKRTYASGPESRAHLLLLPDGAYIASPLTSVLSQPQPPISQHLSTNIAEIPISTLETSTSTLTLHTATPQGSPSVSTYRLHNLPFSIPFTKALISSVLKVGKIAYILDLEDVSSGHIQISEHIDGASRKDVLRFNARDPILDSILSLRDGADEHMLTFCVHDNNRCELEIVVRWT